MDTLTDESVAASCDYCGRENPDRLPRCPVCNTLLVVSPPPIPKPKSKVLAVCLAFIFGPIGLLYVRAWGTMVVTILVGSLFYITRTRNLWVALIISVFCAFRAYYALADQDNLPNPELETSRLLDAAARLESVDRAKAVVAYEEIVRLYPDTSASREATRNIQTLLASGGR